MKRNEKIKEKLIMEINNCVLPKMFNFQKGTITEKNKQVLFEALGFMNMIQFSILDIKEIKKVWDNSNLAYM